MTDRWRCKSIPTNCLPSYSSIGASYDSWNVNTPASAGNVTRSGGPAPSSHQLVEGHTTSEASLGPPRWAAGWAGSLRLAAGWGAVRACPPAIAASPRGWALVRTGLVDQAGGHGCGGDGKRCG